MFSRAPFILAVLIVVQGVLVSAQSSYTECSHDTMRLCRRNIEDVLLGAGNTRKLDLEDQCWRIRHNFDCMQWQTSMCVKRDEQENNSDIILKAWRFLEGFCENFKNWWTKTCYQTERLKQCENLLTSGRTVDSEACRAYINFRECATSAIERDCSSDDQRYLGIYLKDKGQQKSWRCPRDDRRYNNRPVNAPLASNTRELNSREIMYSDSSSSYGTCAYDVIKPAQNCLTTFEDAQKSARDLIEEEKRKEKVCCGLKHYETCVTDAVREKCGDAGAREGHNIISSVTSRLHMNCDDYDKSTCSAASFLTVTNIWLTVGFLTSFLASSFAVYVF